MSAPTCFDDATQQLVAEGVEDRAAPVGGRDENFFDMAATRCRRRGVRRIGEWSCASSRFTDVFRYPTIRTFAAHLARVGGRTGPTHTERRKARRR